ncbi:MAG: NBR1-Ig-like domain-containing protein [Chloroflexota bacterium]
MKDVNMRVLFPYCIVFFVFLLLGCNIDTGALLPDIPGENTNAGEGVTATEGDSDDFQRVLIGAEATIDQVEIRIIEATDSQINTIVHGSLPNSCVSLERLDHSRLIDSFWVNVVTARTLDGACDTVVSTFAEGLQLDIVGLPSGTYTVTASSSNTLANSFFLSPDQVVLGEPKESPSLNTDSNPSQATINGTIWVDTCEVLENGQPTNGCILGEGGLYQPDRIPGEDEARIAGILVNLHQGSCPGGDILITKATNISGIYTFDNLPTGFYCVSVDSSTGPNPVLLQEGRWRYPEVTDDGPTTFSSHSLGPGETQASNFGWQRTSNLPVVSNLADNADCIDAAAYVSDLTIPDDTVIVAGEAFTKTWQVRNEGTCSWGPGYVLFFEAGDQLGGPDTVPFQAIIPTGREVAISVPMVAPLEAGTYRSDWKLRGPDGYVFGSLGDFSFYVQIVVAESGE